MPAIGLTELLAFVVCGMALFLPLCCTPWFIAQIIKLVRHYLDEPNDPRDNTTHR